MKKESYRINVRRTDKGDPKGSYTVHEVGRCGTHERKPENWKRFSSREALDAFGVTSYLGACGKCWTDPDERAEENRKLAALFAG
ncbi:hypothetical protein [Achromobacter sp.]|uniref:hypothetical protein n=1 Tax=Achromobacter sp. TaxID=134375 RepID=UPI003CFBF4EB